MVKKLGETFTTVLHSYIFPKSKDKNMTLTQLLTESKEILLVEGAVFKKGGKYFAQKKNGDIVGSKQGYDTPQEAARALYNGVLSTFQHMDIPKQDAKIKAFLKKRGKI
jgi:hypothetical protein